ncbi:hypothetical protein FACS1894176_02620 [Bacteroidia bacterium]|nr:hypothetical protein FACS1894176_02620 [Bacteroidia bacterium]
MTIPIICKCKPFTHSFDFQHEQRKIVTCSDKGHPKIHYIYNNKSNDYLSTYRVDGGLIVKKDAKCDYLLLNCNRKQAFFIELKGSDINHAIEQIDSSIDLLKSNIPDFTIHARIVLTRYNTINIENNPKYLQLKRKVKSLKKQTRKIEDIN